MKTELNREEFREKITDAFDKTNPDSYSKNSIFSEIEDRLEDSTGKSTIMQTMFRVRRVCMASLAVLIIAALSGGTYSAVSVFRSSSNFADGQGQSAGGDNSGMNQSSDNDKDSNQNNETGNNNDSNKASNKANDNKDSNQDKTNNNNGNNNDTNNNDNNDDKTNDANDNNDVSNNADKPASKFSYQEDIVKCFRENCAQECYDIDTSLRELRDDRLADAIEAAVFEPETKIVGHCEFTYVGMVAGTGISDRIFDKKEKHAFVIVAQRYMGDVEQYERLLDTTNCYICGIEASYMFVYNDVMYRIFDVTNAPLLSKDNRVKIEVYCYGGTYNDDGMYINEVTEDCYFDIDLTDVFGKDTLSEAKKQYKMKEKILSQFGKQRRAFEIFNNFPNRVSFDNWNNYLGLFESRKHMKKEYEKFKKYKKDAMNSYRTFDNITDNLEEFQTSYPETVTGGAKLLYSIDYKAFANPYLPDGESDELAIEKYGRKYFYKFKDLTITPQNGLSESNIDSVTITVDNAALCRVRQATGKEEREYEKSGYLGSMINNTGVGGGEYSVYLDYGNSVTIPYDNMSRLDEYGIYIQRPVIDYKDYKEGIDLDYDDKFWQVDYLKDNVKIHIKVNTYEGTDEQVLVFGNNYYYDQELLGKIGYTVCGWE